MPKQLPIDFEKKVKLPPSPDGRGYPFQIPAKDLMENFKFLLGLIPDGISKNDIIVFNGTDWVIHRAPAATGTFVFGVVDGTPTWLATEECA